MLSCIVQFSRCSAFSDSLSRSYSFSFLVFLPRLLCDSLFIIPHFFAFVKPFFKVFSKLFSRKQMFFVSRSDLSFSSLSCDTLPFVTPQLSNSRLALQQLVHYITFRSVCQALLLKFFPQTSFKVSTISALSMCSAISRSFITLVLPLVRQLYYYITSPHFCQGFDVANYGAYLLLKFGGFVKKHLLHSFLYCDCS